MIERVLKRHGFWLSQRGEEIVYVTHNEAYGGIYVSVNRDKNTPWKYKIMLEVKELEKKFEFDSAKRLEEFIKRIERNTEIYGFRPGMPVEMLKKELDEAFSRA
ncbi:MAG: hypothetical protein QXL15_01410 [Candidatus Korarchaeota archaeon]